MTDAHVHAIARIRLKPLFILAAVALVLTGCTSKSKTYSSYKFDEYQGFSARNDFITQSDADGSDPEARLLAEADQNVLSGNLFDQQRPSRKRLAQEKVISENLFELASIHQHKGGVFERMLRTASSQLGRRYRSGGCDPSTGFDCSGFTTWVFNKYGIHLPRSSREQFQTGTAVAKNKLRKGDLVFFRSRRGVNHVGIYLENGKFIHSASNGKTVTISHLEDDYWRTHYAGGRRVF